jgi:hypothetical protein
MNSNLLPENWDLARGLGKVQESEAQEAKWNILDQQGVDLDPFHKSIHILPSSHNSHSRTGQLHDHWLRTRCKQSFRGRGLVLELEGLAGVLALAEEQEAK